MAVTKLTAQTTSSGTTALVSRYGPHTAQRMKEYNLTDDMLSATLKHGTKYYDLKNNSFVYILREGLASGKGIGVATNPQTGFIKTVMTGTKVHAAGFGLLGGGMIAGGALFGSSSFVLSGTSISGISSYFSAGESIIDGNIGSALLKLTVARGFSSAYSGIYSSSLTGLEASAVTLTTQYMYDATGTKLRQQTLVNDVPGVQTDYSTGFVYENDVLDFIQFAEGRVRPIAPIITQSYQYEYDLTDHLGNVRATFKTVEGYDSDTHTSVYGATLIQADDYYPFGLKMPDYSYIAGGAEENKFTYNGKELEDEFGLDWYHYGARFYDPVVGRWWAIDPLDEFSSVYNYVGNDPISYVDPDGASSEEFDPCKTNPLFCAGFWNGLKEGAKGTAEFLTDGMWKAQTYNDMGSLLLTISLSRSGNVSSLYAADEYLGTNTVDTYQALSFAISDLGDQLASGNMYTYGELGGKFTWSLGEAFVGAKGLNNLSKIKFTTTSSRVFWSGGGNPAVEAAARQFATKNGFTTLEMTRAGKNLTNLTEGMSWAEKAPLWNRLSSQFARGARGNVHVFQNSGGVRINSTFGQIEYPILKSNNANIIYHNIK